jgi:DNA-binding NtrC family response regulator
VARPLAARLQEEERREIVAAIEQCGGNIAGAARLLGINRSTLYYRLRKHGLEHLLPTRPGAEAGAAGEAAESATPAE